MRHEVTSGDALMTLSSTGKALSSTAKSAASESMAGTAGSESCPGTNRLQRLEAIEAILHVDDLAVAQAKALEQLDRVATVRSAPFRPTTRPAPVCATTCARGSTISPRTGLRGWWRTDGASSGPCQLGVRRTIDVRPGGLKDPRETRGPGNDTISNV